MLARREHSLPELRVKLLRKGHPVAVVAEVVARLGREGLASAERFCEALLTARSARGYGPVRIQRDLQEKGITAEAIDRLLDFSSGEWLVQLRRVKQKKFGAALPRDPAEWARQARYLHSRGFTVDQIQRVLNPGAED